MQYQLSALMVFLFFNFFPIKGDLKHCNVDCVSNYTRMICEVQLIKCSFHEMLKFFRVPLLMEVKTSKYSRKFDQKINPREGGIWLSTLCAVRLKTLLKHWHLKQHQDWAAPS